MTIRRDAAGSSRSCMRSRSGCPQTAWWCTRPPDRVLFGAAAPLGLLAPRLRAAGAQQIVGLTHGHEAGWAALPGARSLLRRIGDEVDVLTYLAEYFRIRMARALSGEAAGRMVRLAPGVDPAEFR